MNFDVIWNNYDAIKKRTQEWIIGHREGMGITSAVFVFATLAFVLVWVGAGAPKKDFLHAVGQALAIIWAIAPPIYFFLEWWSWTPTKAEADLNERKFEFDQFKYTQEVATKFWIGFAGSLTVLFFTLK